jgi:hypothetical protein
MLFQCFIEEDIVRVPLPYPRNFEIPTTETLIDKTQFFDQSYRSMVPWHNIGFYTVQAEMPESKRYDLLHSLPHVSMAGHTTGYPVTEKAREERSINYV